MTNQDPTLRASRIEREGSDGVAIRQIILDDAPALLALIEYDRAHLSQNHGGNIDGTADKYQTLEDLQRSISEGDPAVFRFGIWSKDNLVGYIKLTPDPKEPGSAESGSWVGAQHKGHHFAARARNLMVELAFNDLGFTKVFSDIAVDNDASRRSVEKSGFEYKGIIQKADENGVLWPYWRYAVHKDGMQET
jgi:RimJ/RimL family protein N-acetyltransferase